MTSTYQLGAAILVFMLGSTVLQLLTAPQLASRRRAFVDATVERFATLQAVRTYVQDQRSARQGIRSILGVIGAALIAVGAMALQAFFVNH